MKTPTGTMQTDLANNSQFLRADLYTITLKSGAVIRSTSWPTAIVIGGNTFLPGPPSFQRGKITDKIGMDTATMDLTVTARPTDLISGLPVTIFIIQRGLSGCFIKVETLIMLAPGALGSGTVIAFQGFIDDATAVGATSATLKCSSITALMDVQIPFHIIQPACWNTLFDAGCTLTRSAFKVSSSALAGSTKNTLVTSLVNVIGYFDQGVAEFTSGPNAGYKISIRSYASGVVTLASPAPNNVSIADTFDLYPGCDKLQTTCNLKFSNSGNWVAMPFVPQPEAVI